MQRHAAKKVEFTWPALSEKAAHLVAAGNLDHQRVADLVGIDRTTLWRWRRHPDFMARVDAHLSDFREEIRRVGLADLHRRLAALNDRWLRMRQVIEARADNPSMAEVPGGRTGLLCRQVKGIGRGDDFQMVETYEVDVGLLKELRRAREASGPGSRAVEHWRSGIRG